MDIVVIGGGFSGCSFVAQAVQRMPSARITVVERSGICGAGPAYSTPYASHLLNVRASSMSVYPDDPSHFVRWLKDTAPTDFAQRRRYGDYLRETFAQTNVQVVEDEAVDVSEGFQVHLKKHAPLKADRVLVCIGQAPPRLPRGVEGGPNVIVNPWQWHLLQKIPKDADVLLLGTGLTMVDVALALKEDGFVGRLSAMSRHGLLPQRHDAEPGTPLNEPIHATTCTGILRELRRRVKDHPWRDVVDGLRQETPAMWRAMGEQEQRRFFKHLRTYWDVHRHRIAPKVADALPDMYVRSGRADKHTRYGYLINCTGTLPNFAQSDMPLLKNLFAKRYATPGPLGLGMQLRYGLHALGGALLGRDFESVAVPELRAQAKAAVDALS